MDRIEGTQQHKYSLEALLHQAERDIQSRLQRLEREIGRSVRTIGLREVSGNLVPEVVRSVQITLVPEPVKLTWGGNG